MITEENKDYSAGAEVDELEFNSPEELNKYLEGNETVPTTEELEEIAAKDDATDEQKAAAVNARTAEDASGGSPDAGKGDGTIDKPDDKDKPIDKPEEEEFTSTLQYLNKTHELGLNMEDIPEDMTREQEAEAISGVIERMVNGVNSQVSQYEDIRTLMQDSEIANFIKAKSEGKTMTDFVQQYVGTTGTMTDEQLAKDELKVKLPHLSDEDISTQVKSMIDREKLTEFTDKIREDRKTIAAETEEANKNQVALQQKQQEDTRIAEINEFGQFMQDKTELYGIPLNTDMKKQIFSAATQTDTEGETYLEKALQSNEGVLLATAGLLHMQRLMKGYASLDVNQRKKSFMDTLFDSPDALQSASSEHTQKGFDIDAANQF